MKLTQKQLRLIIENVIAESGVKNEETLLLKKSNEHISAATDMFFKAAEISNVEDTYVKKEYYRLKGVLDELTLSVHNLKNDVIRSKKS